MPAPHLVPPLELPKASGRINPELYFDRELSWLTFNQRVLEEAQDPRHPLLERVKFLAIFSTNLDEFFMIRVSAVKRQMQSGVSQRAPSGLSPREQYRAIRAALLPQLTACQQLLKDDLLPALSAADIRVLRYDELSQWQRDALRNYYVRDVFPVLTPLAIDASHPFPFVSNLNVNLVVVINDPQLGQLYARVKVPDVLPRLLLIPPEPDSAGQDASPATTFIWLEEVIAANLADLFPGKTVAEVSAFRVTRDADFEIQEDEAADLLETVAEEVRQRPYGSIVRLSLAAQTNETVKEWLIANLEIEHDDAYSIDGLLRLGSLMELYDLDRPDLKDPTFVPAVPDAFHAEADMFAGIRQQPILLHHPFDSFAPILDLMKAAAHDPNVLAIKQTLYRVGRNARVVAALLEARDEYKQVAALVELKARFDEENNIEWSRELESRGVHVVYGLRGLKIHAKLLIIVRKEEDGLRRYVHMGTGNYNSTAARGYTDFGLLTCDEDIGVDVTELFNVLTGYSDQTHYRKLLVAPHGLREAMLAKIEREIAQQQATGNGQLIFKFNALTDEQIILALYRASQAGVQIDLIVRGICCLRPGIPGVSETIRVRSIVGRFLEHSRVYYFHNGGAEEIYLGSADLMERNLDRRVETLFPVEDERLKRYLRDTVLALYLQDNTQARELQSDGAYIRLTSGDNPPVNAQERLLDLVTRTPGHDGSVSQAHMRTLTEAQHRQE